jgi:hypothetical protein
VNLTSGQLPLNKHLMIDASALPFGLTINGNRASRILEVPGCVNVSLNSLTLTNVATGGDFGGAPPWKCSLNLPIHRPASPESPATLLSRPGALTRAEVGCLAEGKVSSWPKGMEPRKRMMAGRWRIAGSVTPCSQF